MESILKGRGDEVVVSPGRPTVVIGERINPTGKKRLAAALKEGDLELVRSEARAQVDAGADLIDVNVGTAGVDEVELLPQAVQAVMETVDAPVSIDSANPEALRAALKAHRQLAPEGRPLVNSVTGEAAKLDSVLPLVAEFDAAVIALALDDDGIPTTAEGRLAAAEKIARRAEGLGIPPERVIVDCIAMTVGADSSAGALTLDAIALVRDGLGLNLTLGVSNVSHGLPERNTLNLAFLVMAIAAGVNCPIVDAAKVRTTVLATDVLLGRDRYAMRYIRDYKQRLESSAGK